MVDIPLVLPPLDSLFAHNTVWLYAAGFITLFLTRYAPESPWARRGYAILGFIIGGVNLGAGVTTFTAGGHPFTAAMHLLAGMALTVHVALQFQPDFILTGFASFLVYTNFPADVFENPYIVLSATAISRIHWAATLLVALVVFMITHAIRHSVETATNLVRSKSIMPALGLAFLVEGSMMLLYHVSLWVVIMGG